MPTGTHGFTCCNAPTDLAMAQQLSMARLELMLCADELQQELLLILVSGSKMVAGAPIAVGAVQPAAACAVLGFAGGAEQTHQQVMVGAGDECSPKQRVSVASSKGDVQSSA